MSGPQPSGAAGMTSPVRLIWTLGGLGALAGLLIVFVFQATQPAIQAHRAAVLRDAIHEVLGGPDRHDTLYVVGDALVAEPPDGADRAGLETVYLGYRDDRAVGYAIHAAAPGFQDTISLLFGYDPETGTLLGMTVLESKETPGLGDKIYKDLKFVEAFAGVSPPLIGVKAGAGKGAPGEVEMITGATISSRTVIKAINAALERVGPALSAGRKDTP